MPLGNPPEPQTGHAGQPGDPIPDPFTVSSDPVPVPAPAAAVPQHPTLKEIVARLATRDQRWKAISFLRCVLLCRSARLSPDAAALNKLSKELGDLVKSPRLSTVGIACGVSLIEQQPEHLDYDWFGDANQSAWVGSVDASAAELLVTRRLLQYLEASIGIAQSDDAVKSWSWATSNSLWQDLMAATPVGVTCTPLTIDWVMTSKHTAMTAVIQNGKLVLKTPIPADRTGLIFK